MLVILIKKTYSKFSYCYTGLGARCSSRKKKTITTSFEKHFKENQASTLQW